MKRSGYMVTCARDSDRRRRCPIHPLTGEHYYCQKKPALRYAQTKSHACTPLGQNHLCTCADYAYTDDDGGVSLHAPRRGALGRPGPRGDGAGGRHGHLRRLQLFGLCADHPLTARARLTLGARWQYSQTCPIKPLSQAVSAIAGCGDTLISTFLCGLEVDRIGPDGSGVSIKGGIAYPRTLA